MTRTKDGPIIGWRGKEVSFVRFALREKKHARVTLSAGNERREECAHARERQRGQESVCMCV